MSFSIAALRDPGVVHFSSWATGVSFELPVGFEAAGSDATSARYQDGGRVVQVEVVGAVDAGAAAAAVHALADGFAATGELLDRGERTVDDSPATTVVTLVDGRLRHQTAVAADGRLLSIVGTGPGDDADALRPLFDTAVESVRIIAL